MRKELDNIYEAIAALSVKTPQAQPPRRPIGYKQPTTAAYIAQLRPKNKPYSYSSITRCVPYGLVAAYGKEFSVFLPL